MGDKIEDNKMSEEHNILIALVEQIKRLADAVEALNIKVEELDEVQDET